MSLGDIAEIGKDSTDNSDGIRRYDIDPKVYPDDIIGGSLMAKLLLELGTTLTC